MKTEKLVQNSDTKWEICKIYLNILLLILCRELRPRPEKVAEEIKVEGKTEPKIPTKCRECKQLLDNPDLKMFIGDPEDAVSIFFCFFDISENWNCAQIAVDDFIYDHVPFF